MPRPPPFALPIEDYALIGDCTTGALVGRNGSIDWLCWPRFDSGACFAALLGTPEHGAWQIAPEDPAPRIRRAYRNGGMVLDTIFETAGGAVCLTDFMAINAPTSAVVRIVRGLRGQVPMHMNLRLRFDYGISVPWVTRLPDHCGIIAIVGPDMAVLRGGVPLHGQDMATVASFEVAEGQAVAFVMSHGPSHLPPPAPLDAEAELVKAEKFWADWTGRAKLPEHRSYGEPLRRSLVTLKALTYAPTGGIVAAPTTSLPEQLGGTRNWDYRFCWLRDATLTLVALMQAGYYDEAQAWRDWLHRSIAGSPEQIQIMYGLSGERRLDEWEVSWLPGYQGAAPVRVGNGAAGQIQLDVYGEVMDALHQARRSGLNTPPATWALQRGIIDHLEQVWEEADEGMWEVRGGRQKFTLSKVMAWVALDRAVRDAERLQLPAPLRQWQALRDTIHETVCREGYDAERNCFVQSFGSRSLDAGLLLLPLVGFLPPEDPRISGTVAAIERDLVEDGFVLRYRTDTQSPDGMPPGEGAFLPCSFWLADNLKLQNREAEARALFERLLALRNDVGLLAEEYDPKAKRMVGNFPQAFSHVALIGTAMNLRDNGPAQIRAGA